MIANSITKLQTALRCWLLRKKFLKNRAAAVTVQAWMRGERTRATVGREMAELVRKRKEKEAMELEAARLAELERQKQIEEQALSVRLGQVRRLAEKINKYHRTSRHCVVKKVEQAHSHTRVLV